MSTLTKRGDKMKHNTVRIALNQVQIGMKSAENIHNSSGLLLVPKNASINQTHLFRMKLYQIFNILVYNNDLLQIQQNAQSTDQQVLPDNITNNKAFLSFMKYYDKAIIDIKNLIGALMENKAVEDELYQCCNNVLSSMDNPNLLFEYLYHIKCKNIENSVFLHSLNVALLCNIFGTWLRLSDSNLKELTLSGLLHDVGKCDIDPDILNKPGKLTQQEFVIIKSHPLNGFTKFKETNLSYGIKMAILQHHEKLDGSGYPFGFCKEEIHDYASIVAIIDMYEAMTTDRAYHKRIPPFMVLDIFEKDGYEVLDSHFLSVFLENLALLYIGKSVILNNGESGKIVFINRKTPSRPLVQVGSKIYNLEFEMSIEITDVL